MTGSRPPQDTNKLTAEDLELLAYLLKEEGIEPAQQQVTPRKQEFEEIPLSYGQERLWFLDQLEPGSHLHKMNRAYQLTGLLDVPALEQSINEIVRRHEALRTTFTVVAGRPLQIIAPVQPLSLSVLDLRDLPESTRWDEAQRLVEEEHRQPFDLAQGPLLRASLLRLQDEEHVLLIGLHHIVTDGWSMRILRHELSALYNAFSAGQPSPLPALPIQYADYALWHREWLQDEVLETQLNYWKQQLAAAPSALELPTNHPRPPIQTYRGARQSLEIPKDVTQALKALSQREGATLFMTLLAAFNTLLFRLTGQDDVIVGTPIAGRNRSEIEGLIGLFLNNLVLRTDLSGQPSFLELLHRVRDTSLAAYDHQDIPFEKLLEVLQPERDLSRTPLFQIFFNMVPEGNNPWNLDGLSVTALPRKGARSNFDLTAYVSDLGDNIRLSFVYNADLFDQARMAEMVAQYQHLLTQITASPAKSLSQYSLVTPGANNLLPDPTQTLSASWHGPIHAACTSHAERTPDQVAVADTREQWTYQELDQATNQLANRLRSDGIQPGDIVAINGYRNATLVLAILGVLKAGAAFLILDPAYPPTRLADYLGAAQPNGWIHIKAAGEVPEEVQKLLDTFSLDCQITLLSREEAHSHLPLGSSSTGDPAVNIGPDDLACVVFTSGSTGRPKGVLGRHGSLTHFMAWRQELCHLTQHDRFAVLSGLAYSPLQRDIFTPLWLGATILIPDADTIGTSGQLARWMSQQRISFATLTPAMSQILTETNPDLSLPSLRNVFFLGDKLTRDHVAGLRRLAPAVVCINSYGSTESQRAEGFYVVPAETEEDRPKAVYPVGRGMPDVQLLLLNDGGQMAGVGELAEIHIRSPHLARGYLGDEALTQARFLDNFFTTVAGDRLYRMGDLGRYLPDGTVEIVGRADRQVKIRGFRIEPGEIEAVLRQFDGLQDAVVLAREDQPGQRRLVAYIVPAQKPVPTHSELRSFLSSRLPDHMVPSAFVMLDALPLTPNRKPDLRALPVPDWSRPELEDAFVAPRSAVEEILAGIWADILNVERVGINHNFFELGGHSLLATQVMSRLRDAFGVELPLRSLFETPTIASLAESVEIARQAQPSSTEEIPRQPNLGSAPLSYAQERMWFLDQLDPASPLRKLFANLILTGPLDVPALEQSLDELVRRHDALRTTFSMVDGQPLQTIAPVLTLTLPVLDLRDLPESKRRDEAQRLAQDEAQKPFDLVHGPLLKAILLQLQDEEHVLLLSIHHIVSDGSSMAILRRELSILYDAFSAGEPSPLPELPVQYADYALWQRKWLQDEVLETQLSYWKQQLAKAPPALELPADYPRPPVQTYRGARQSLDIPKDVTQALKALSQREGATLFMTLLAAFNTLLFRLTGQDDVIVGTPIAGRNRSEIEGLIGLFLNNLVLRTDLSGQPSFLELLSRVRETALAAYEHQDIPFEQLLEELQPERELGRTPYFQVFFNMLPARMLSAQGTPVALQGLSVSRFPRKGTRSNFDLTAYVSDLGDNIRVNFVYNADLFSQARMAEVLAEYRQLLELVVESPEKPILAHSLVTPEAHTLLPDPRTPLAEPPQESVMHMFTTWAERAPESTAVIQGNRMWTYSTLSKRARLLARHLIARGMGPGDVVAVFGSRSLGLIASMIGTLLSGCVLLPIDPTLPRQRQDLMLREAGARAMLQVGRTRLEAEWLPGAPALDVLLVDQETGKVLGAAPGVGQDSGVLPDLRPDDPAYIFFTSGTTGMPKGVLGCHKGLGHFLAWQRDTFAIGPGDRAAQLTGLSFDVVLRDIFIPLVSGATLCLPEGAEALGPDDLLHWLEEERITIAHAVPSLAQFWLAHVPPGVSLRTIRYVFMAGEPLTDTLVHQWRAAFSSGAEIVNLYGPTETTMAKCFYRVPADPLHGVQPTGLSLPQAQALVLTKENRLCGIGEQGEIVIRTPFRTLGFVNASEEDSKRFVPNPFRDDEGDLLYHTGDRGRYRPDGLLEILGRLDDQVKIRGVRVEPGEVTATLARYPAVEACVVVPRKHEQDGTYLAAYVVASESDGPTVGQLRTYLNQHLPAALVPSAFVFLDQLPLTPNGKVDRRALPEPDRTLSQLETAYVAPRTPEEEALSTIWAQVLGVERVGVHDNFFDLGGHSLLGVRLFALINKTLDVDLPLVALFQAPTIEGLATIVHRDKASKADEWSPLVSMRPTGSKPPLFVVPGNLGIVFTDLGHLAQHLGPDQPFYGLQDGPRNPIRVRSVAARYLQEIRRVQREGPYLLAGVCSGAVVAYEMAQQLWTQGEEVSLLAMVEPNPPQKPDLRTATRFIASLFQRYRRRIGHHVHTMAQLSSTGQGEYTRLKLKVVANRWAVRRYAPRPYPGRLEIFLTETSLSRAENRQVAWHELAEGGAQVHEIPGTHATIVGLSGTPIEEAHMQALAEQMNTCIEQALADE